MGVPFVDLFFAIFEKDFQKNTAVLKKVTSLSL